MIKLNTMLYRELMAKPKSYVEIGSYIGFIETPVSFKVKRLDYHYPKSLYKRLGDNIVKISLWSYSDREKLLIYRGLM